MTEADVSRMFEEYHAHVKQLFADGSSEVAGNASFRHAAILIEEMILHSEHSFCAFAGRMNPVVWNERVMQALAQAVENGVEVKLVVERTCEPITNGTMPVPLRKFVRRLDPKVLETIRDKITHCATGDGKSMRIETNSEKGSAVFSANSQDMATMVKSVVDGLYNLATDLGDAA